MHNISSDAFKLSFLCPLCKGYTFSQHWMSEYSRDWNKCPSCGYMEEKTVSVNRILSKLDPDRLDEPFEDPVTNEIIEKAVNIGIYGNGHKCCKNCKCGTKTTRRNKKNN